ncbi:Molybdopterin synthase catalytic subunit [Pseudidiomarina piscicola]|uniref:Molybdopterin synthase catalytic subunit n=1 Tax=Pseudidiomarina piscicola TaxID=2614830 RepID=A0A6S6WN60_9GAMM|nr:molybdopterin synthase catalytic subunit MoaE [Pseudidiomarina piscicola]CAB0151499.1 Molybdopterin synthase catalytic subunit [Pseudidiomarina piscicola]VZT40978.1 Molybdopterin synthase catalytic subunit [Pseudomonas aeruginosa]
MGTEIRVQQDDFSVADEYQQLAQESSCGAVVTFAGLVRELAEGQLDAMTLEHYPGMTEQVLADLVAQARGRWQLGQVTLIHRVGRLALNDQIVFVGVAAPHRKAAFEAAMFIMDFLKTQAPFWKQEHTTDGSYWVAAKDTDQAAATAWQDD